MKSNRTLVQTTGILVSTFLLAICGIAGIAFANDDKVTAETDSTVQTNTAVGSSTVPTEKSNPEILQELEQLRTKVQELEKQLNPPAESSTTNVTPDRPQSGMNPTIVAPLPDVTPTSIASQPAQEEATNESESAEKVEETKPAAFAFADWTWLTGNPRTKESPLTTKYFVGEFRVDTAFHQSFNNPSDDTISGSTEVFRSGEIQLTQLALGGDFSYNNVRGRLLTQFGMYSQTQPRNDPSPARGQWQLDNAYRYLSEAYGGYHFNKMYGINVDAGIFLSYIGLFSFYQFDNWAYQPSYVSSNTPWYFMGLRVQLFPSEKLKIEPWLINGWQAYGKFNKAPGIGGQVLYRPNGNISLVFNNYYGTDTLGNKDRKRFHTDDSIQVKYYDNPDSTFDKAAFTFTFDAGCEWGGGVSCSGGDAASPSQYFLGFMVYNRLWFHKDLFGLTLGGGAIKNPGRYLVLFPPINGATAFSGAPAYFTAAPGDKFTAWDGSITFDWMPSQFTTFRWELNYRAANVPYFAGEGGLTPIGGNQGPPGSFVEGFTPDLVKDETRMTVAVLVKL